MKKHIVVINQVLPQGISINPPTAYILKKYLGCNDLKANVIDWGSRLVELQKIGLSGITIQVH